MKWNEVTWYSRLGAIVLFLIIIPALSFYIGVQYVETFEVINNPNIVSHENELFMQMNDAVIAPVSWIKYINTNKTWGIGFAYPPSWTLTMSYRESGLQKGYILKGDGYEIIVERGSGSASPEPGFIVAGQEARTSTVDLNGSFKTIVIAGGYRFTILASTATAELPRKILSTVVIPEQITDLVEDAKRASEAASVPGTLTTISTTTSMFFDSSIGLAITYPTALGFEKLGEGVYGVSDLEGSSYSFRIGETVFIVANTESTRKQAMSRMEWAKSIPSEPPSPDPFSDGGYVICEHGMLDADFVFARCGGEGGPVLYAYATTTTYDVFVSDNPRDVHLGKDIFVTIGQ